MAKRGRKRSTTSIRKKRNHKTANPSKATKNIIEEANNVMNSNDNEEEAWVLMRFISFDELSRDDKTICDSADCQLSALYVYEGTITNQEWKSCIDCQLNDYEKWPSPEECKDATEDTPFTKAMEEIVRIKCTKDKGIEIPSHIAHIDINQTAAIEDNFIEENMASSLEGIIENIESSNEQDKDSTTSDETIRQSNLQLFELSQETVIVELDEMNAINTNESIADLEESNNTQQDNETIMQSIAEMAQDNQEDVIEESDEMNVSNTNESINVPDESNARNDTNERRNIIDTTIERNDNDKPATGRKKRKHYGRTSFSNEMIDLMKKGLVNLDTVVMNKATGKPYETGLYITCIPCSKYRQNTDGNIYLRRPFYEYYYQQHCENKTHITARQIFNRNMSNSNKRKEKSYNQTMMSSFLVPKNKTTDTNQSSNTINTERGQPINDESNENGRRNEIMKR